MRSAKEHLAWIKDKVFERRAVDIDFPLEQAIANLTAAATDLLEPRIEIDKDYGYEYECHVTVMVEGWRLKTRAEYEAEQQRLELDKENARKSKEGTAKAEWIQAQNLYKKYKQRLKGLDDEENN